MSHVAVCSLSFSVNDVVNILSTIFKIAHEIREISRRTTANKHQCERLSRRIQVFVAVLRERQLSDIADQSTILTLTNFAIFLQECVEFMNKFTHASFIKRLWYNRNYFDKFTALQTELTEFGSDFNMSTTLKNMLVNKNQDQYDQQLDLIHMQQLLNIQNSKHSFSSVISKPVNIPIYLEYEDQIKNTFESGIWTYSFDFEVNSDTKTEQSSRSDLDD